MNYKKLFILASFLTTLSGAITDSHAADPEHNNGSAVNPTQQLDKKDYRQRKLKLLEEQNKLMSQLLAKDNGHPQQIICSQGFSMKTKIKSASVLTSMYLIFCSYLYLSFPDNTEVATGVLNELMNFIPFCRNTTAFTNEGPAFNPVMEPANDTPSFFNNEALNSTYNNSDQQVLNASSYSAWTESIFNLMPNIPSVDIKSLVENNVLNVSNLKQSLSENFNTIFEQLKEIKNPTALCDYTKKLSYTVLYSLTLLVFMKENITCSMSFLVGSLIYYYMMKMVIYS